MNARVLGMHEGCGGQVVFETSTTMGWRHCSKCHGSTLRGQSIEVIADATPKKAINDTGRTVAQ